MGIRITGTMIPQPKVFEAATKEALIAKIAGSEFRWRCASLNRGRVQISGLHNEHRDVLRLFNAQKFRRKARRLKDTVGTVVVRKSHWVAYVYDFKMAKLDGFTVFAHQHARTFTMNITI